MKGKNQNSGRTEPKLSKRWKIEKRKTENVKRQRSSKRKTEKRCRQMNAGERGKIETN